VRIAIKGTKILSETRESNSGENPLPVLSVNIVKEVAIVLIKLTN
jgi:hypothetical protein